MLGLLFMQRNNLILRFKKVKLSAWLEAGCCMLVEGGLNEERELTGQLDRQIDRSRDLNGGESGKKQKRYLFQIG